MPNWQDFLAALGGFGTGAAGAIGARGRENEEMEFRAGQQERLFGQQERMQTRGFQQQTELEKMREAGRTAREAQRGTVPIVGLPSVFRSEFQTPPPESELMQHTIEEAGRPGTQPIPRPQIREPERVDERILGPLGTILGQREARAAKPGYSVEDLTKMFQGGGPGGLEMETKLPIAGGGEASFKRPRPEPTSPEARAQRAYENIAMGRGTAEDEAVIKGYENRVRAGQEFKNLSVEQLISRALNGDKQAQAELDAMEKRQIRINAASGQGRAQGFGEIRQIPVIDTQNGNRLVFANANEINAANLSTPGRFIPAGQGATALNKETLIQDIKGNIVLAREAINGLRTPFTTGQRAQMAYLLRSNDPRSAMTAFLGSTVAQSLTPDQQDYIVALNQLQENAMAMRSVLGAGQGSDELRAAILRTIPSGATPNAQMAHKQLDAFELTLNRLARGIPTVPLKPMPEAAPGAKNPARPPAPGKPPGRRMVNPTTGQSGYWDAATGTWSPER